MLSSGFAALAALSLCFLGQSTAQSGYGSSNSSSSSNLPVVDLGYELHQATLYNSTGGFYNFSNIRYAAPPTGENRFRAPQPPATNRSVVQQGLPDRICPQADPAWLLIAGAYIPEYLAGQKNFTPSEFSNLTSSSGGLPPQDPRTTEDCLFLDVVVPENIFNNAGKGYGAPVLVWIQVLVCLTQQLMEPAGEDLWRWIHSGFEVRLGQPCRLACSEREQWR